MKDTIEMSIGRRNWGCKTVNAALTKPTTGIDTLPGVGGGDSIVHGL